MFPQPFSFIKSEPVSGGSSYRYYRINQNNGGGEYALGIIEWELFTATTAPAYLTSNATDLTLGLGASGYASGTALGQAIAPAFNDSDANGWYAGDPVTECWLAIDLGTAQAARSSNIKFDYVPHSQDITLQGSNDNSSWTTLYTITSPTAQTYSISW